MSRISVLSSLFAVCLLPLGAVAAGDPADAWGKVRLGMSEDEVKQALAPSAVKVSRNLTPGSEAPYVTMDVERYEIAGYDFKGQFSLGQTTHGLARMTFAHNSDQAFNCYTDLSKLLEARYGKSGSEEHAENLIAVTAGRKWVVGDASIRTTFATMRDAKDGYCNLTYEERAAQ